MNKKLIAAAIAAVVAAPAVSAADTTLYGKAHVSIQSNNDNFGSGDNYTVTSNASRIGIKGSEDLGDGLSAIFGYEMNYDMTDGNTGKNQSTNAVIRARDAFVGLAGGFGTFLVGTHATPAKVAFYAAGNDLLGDSIIDFNNIGFAETRANNAIAYVSPSFSGFTVAAAVVPGEQTGGTSTGNATTTTFSTAGQTVTITGLPTTRKVNNDGISDSYSLGMIYGGGGLKAGLSYEVLADGIQASGVTGDRKTWQAGVSYTFGDFQIGAQYEDMDNALYLDAVNKKTYGFAGKANFGNNYVIANYGKATWEITGATPDVDLTTFGIALGHTFSKRTQVYAAYRNQQGEQSGSTSQDNNAFSLGMIHSF